MSFTDGDDVTHELDEIMQKRESSKKRRRSGTKEDQNGSLPQLIIKDLSISPSSRGRPHTVGIATNNQLTNDFDRDDDLEVSYFLFKVIIKVGLREARLVLGD